MFETGVIVLPKLPRDAGDRNRTSPFAFTGNKFEFRAVSSGQSIAGPNTVLNTIVAESLDFIATKLEKPTKGGKDRKSRRGTAAQHHQGEQEGHLQRQQLRGEWHKEAEKRGLPNLKNTVDALPVLIRKDAIEAFTKYKVLNERELHSRYEIMLETYNKTVNVEGQLMVLMANRYILPAALDYQKQVAQSVSAVKSAGGKSVEGAKMLECCDEADRRTEEAHRQAPAQRSRTTRTATHSSTPSTSAIQ